MKYIVIVLAAVSMALPLLAEDTADAKIAKSEELLALFNMEKTFDQTMSQMIKMTIAAIDAQDLPAAEKAEAKKAAEKSMEITVAKFSWERMKPMFTEIYSEVFTVEELQGLIDFYKSPIGRKFIEKQPQLTTATMQKMQGLMREIMPELQKEMEQALTEE